jgi:hypothetical protein
MKAMSSQERVKDILRLKLKIEEELIGKLYAVIRGHAGDRHHEILHAVREICNEFLAEEAAND